jgi:hypothetical protein
MEIRKNRSRIFSHFYLLAGLLLVALVMGCSNDASEDKDSDSGKSSGKSKSAEVSQKSESDQMRLACYQSLWQEVPEMVDVLGADPQSDVTSWDRHAAEDFGVLASAVTACRTQSVN